MRPLHQVGAWKSGASAGGGAEDKFSGILIIGVYGSTKIITYLALFMRIYVIGFLLFTGMEYMTFASSLDQTWGYALRIMLVLRVGGYGVEDYVGSEGSRIIMLVLKVGVVGQHI